MPFLFVLAKWEGLLLLGGFFGIVSVEASPSISCLTATFETDPQQMEMELRGTSVPAELNH